MTIAQLSTLQPVTLIDVYGHNLRVQHDFTLDEEKTYVIYRGEIDGIPYEVIHNHTDGVLYVFRDSVFGSGESHANLQTVNEVPEGWAERAEWYVYEKTPEAQVYTGRCEDAPCCGCCPY